MKNVMCFWRSAKQVNIIVLCALTYAALLIPFKGLQIIPDIAEIRMAAFVPIVFGIVFGPAGAVGCALGNVIADLFGTWSFSSVFGMFGNFMMSYVAYRFWSYKYKTLKCETLKCFKWYKHFYFYMQTAILGILSGALITALGVEIFGYASFLGTFFTIFITNVLFNFLFGWWIVLWMIQFGESLELSWNAANSMMPYTNVMVNSVWWADPLLPRVVLITTGLSSVIAFIRGQKILDAHFNGEMDMLVITNGMILFLCLLGTLFSGREVRQEEIESPLK